MMSKRVQFAPTTTVYAEDESAFPFPSPSFSISSLPSSSSPELQTPPPEDDENDEIPTIYPATPYATQLHLDPLSPEIPYSPKPMHIHFMLAFSPFNEPATSWDISYPPPVAPSPPRDDEQSIMLQQLLTEPATSPPLTALTITHSNLKWHFEVQPKDPAPGAYVSVSDVFTTIFKELRVAIHSSDYAELADVEARSAVDAAYYARCGRVPDPQARLMEHQKGIKRVDMLMGRTRFLGLSGTLSGPESWELNTS